MKRLGLLAVIVLAGCGAVTSSAAPNSASAPAATGSPELTPFGGGDLPTPPPTATPVPTASVSDIAVHIAGAIDALSISADPGQWFLDEATWLTDPANGVSLSNPTFSAYGDAVTAGLKTQIDGGDLAADVRTVLALRPQIAALAPGLVGPPPATPTPARPVVVKGSGSQKTKPFTLPAGDYTVTVTGNNHSNVIAELIGRTSDEQEFLFNEIANGKFRYVTQTYGRQGGSYYLDVTIDGRWVLTFTPLP